MTDSSRAMPSLVPLEQALDYLLAQAKHTERVEIIPLMQASGRVLAENQHALVSAPLADNSAVDGYAVNSRDLEKDKEKCFPVQQRIVAGRIGTALQSGTAARIFTGAFLPEGADAVVMQEQCRVVEGGVVLLAGVQKGQNVRFRGEDFNSNDVLLKQGSVLRPQHVGLLAAMGISHVPVVKPLRIAVFSTGNELVEPGHDLQAGQIYNSNRYLLAGLIKELGCEFVDGGNIVDDLATTKKMLQQAAMSADLVITSGGVSVGEEDYVKNALEAIGRLKLWHLAIKPGKPLAYGEIDHLPGKTPFFGLPGNPAAVLVTFLILVRPYVLKMMGVAFNPPVTIRGLAQFDQKKSSIRREYLRARWVPGPEGQALIYKHDNQSSGMLSSATWANGLAVIDANQTVSLGEPIEFLPFSSLYGA